MPPVVADPLLLLAAGLAIDAWFGDMPALFARIPHPIVLAGRGVAFFDRKLNREIRSEQSRRTRGIITVIVLVGGAAALGWVIEQLCRGSLAGIAVEILLIAILVAQRSLFDHVAAVARALADGGLLAGREAVRHIVGRDPASLDAHGVARAAIESLAENFSDGVVAPVFWYLVLGPARALRLQDGEHARQHDRASDAALSLPLAGPRLALTISPTLVPARISGVLIAAAAFFARDGRPSRALLIMLRDGRKHRSLNAGWPEGAMAGALGLALAGPRRYAEGVVADPWVGEGTARAAPADIGRALMIYRNACLIEWGLVIGAWFAAHHGLFT